MSIWSKNNRACKTVWFTLYVLDQINQPFGQSANIPMGNLTYWRQSASLEIRQVQAKSLAIQLHNNFTLIRRAKLEPGMTAGQAVELMSIVLMDETKTIADLATIADDCYLFLGEELNEA